MGHESPSNKRGNREHFVEKVEKWNPSTDLSSCGFRFFCWPTKALCVAFWVLCSLHIGSVLILDGGGECSLGAKKIDKLRGTTSGGSQEFDGFYGGEGPF